ncbi:hypothetical protein EP331_12310 [bacterium]|nr:MAG: hypothetical protein EP331_12310 [bacterium]
MEILGLSTSPSSGGAYALVLNEHEGSRRLPIIIGTFEAQAIALELEHIRPPRPMTHDLIRNIVQQFNSFVKEVVVNELKEGTFFAKIFIQNEFSEIEVDARPSDAIAVAIRFSAPIYVASKVLDEAGIQSESIQEDVAEAVQPEAFTAEVVEAKTTSQEDILTQLTKNLEAAILAEDYEKAARIRDEINKIKG